MSSEASLSEVGEKSKDAYGCGSDENLVEDFNLYDDEEEKKQLEAHKLASLCYCEKLNSKEDEDQEEAAGNDILDDKAEKVKFADTVVVCPTYTSQVGRDLWMKSYDFCYLLGI